MLVICCYTYKVKTNDVLHVLILLCLPPYNLTYLKLDIKCLLPMTSNCSLLSHAKRSTTVPTKDQNDTVVPAKSDSDVMFCLQSYQVLSIDRSLEY